MNYCLTSYRARVVFKCLLAALLLTANADAAVRFHLEIGPATGGGGDGSGSLLNPNSWQLYAVDTNAESLGIASYYVDIKGATSISHVSPYAGVQDSEGTIHDAGFSFLRTCKNVSPIGALLVLPDQSLFQVNGFGQTAGSLSSRAAEIDPGATLIRGAATDAWGSDFLPPVDGRQWMMLAEGQYGDTPPTIDLNGLSATVYNTNFTNHRFSEVCIGGECGLSLGDFRARELAAMPPPIYVPPMAEEPPPVGGGEVSPPIIPQPEPLPPMVLPPPPASPPMVIQPAPVLPPMVTQPAPASPPIQPPAIDVPPHGEVGSEPPVWIPPMAGGLPTTIDPVFPEWIFETTVGGQHLMPTHEWLIDPWLPATTIDVPWTTRPGFWAPSLIDLIDIDYSPLVYQIGMVIDPSTNFMFVNESQVPEPVTLALIGLAVLGFIGLSRRRSM